MNRGNGMHGCLWQSGGIRLSYLTEMYPLSMYGGTLNQWSDGPRARISCCWILGWETANDCGAEGKLSSSPGNLQINTEVRDLCGDMVYLKLQPYRKILGSGTKLARKFYLSYSSENWSSSLAPHTAQIHPVFHVSQFKKHLGPKAVPTSYGHLRWSKRNHLQCWALVLFLTVWWWNLNGGSN